MSVIRSLNCVEIFVPQGNIIRRIIYLQIYYTIYFIQHIFIMISLLQMVNTLNTTECWKVGEWWNVGKGLIGCVASH